MYAGIGSKKVRKKATILLTTKTAVSYRPHVSDGPYPVLLELCLALALPALPIKHPLVHFAIQTNMREEEENGRQTIRQNRSEGSFS
jgi:hypothetical protein